MLISTMRVVFNAKTDNKRRALNSRLLSAFFLADTDCLNSSGFHNDSFLKSFFAFTTNAVTIIRHPNKNRNPCENLQKPMKIHGSKGGLLDKLDTNRCGGKYFGNLSQRAGILINSEYDNIIRILVTANQEIAIRRNRETARGFAT